MLSLYIPDTPHSETRVSLNTTIYYIILKFSTREQAWWIELLDVNRNKILGANKLVFGSKCTEKISELLGGNLYIYKNTSSPQPLGRNNFGQGKEYELVFLTTKEEQNIVKAIQSQL